MVVGTESVNLGRGCQTIHVMLKDFLEPVQRKSVDDRDYPGTGQERGQYQDSMSDKSKTVHEQVADEPEIVCIPLKDGWCHCLPINLPMINP